MTTLGHLQELDSTYVMGTYARKPVGFVKGSGMELYDTNGERYYDFLSGIGTVNLGHCHPAITEVICEQAHALGHVSNYFHIEYRGELAQKLVELSGLGGKVFFANSGAEANEGAIKLARKWAHANKPGASQIVTMTMSFHGRTLATVAATGQPERALPFAPVMPGFTHVVFNDIDDLAHINPESTVAIMLEVVQGESGVWPATHAYLAHVAEFCAQHNVLLIVDEVQSGMYRTGKPFAFQHFNITPDIITSAKALGNGFPIGAVIAGESVCDTFVPGDHGTTFGGGPLACRVALETLSQFESFTSGENNIEAHVEWAGRYLRTRLAEIIGVENVRGIGLMVGFSLGTDVDMDASAFVEAMLSKGFVINAIGGHHIRLLPPLICKKSHIDALISAVYAIIGSHYDIEETE